MEIHFDGLENRWADEQEGQEKRKRAAGGARQREHGFVAALCREMRFS